MGRLQQVFSIHPKICILGLTSLWCGIPIQSVVSPLLSMWLPFHILLISIFLSRSGASVFSSLLTVTFICLSHPYQIPLAIIEYLLICLAHLSDS
jgi:hypothetical protein